jgi:hypothetical protein
MFSCAGDSVESGVCEHKWDKWKRSEATSTQGGSGIVYERECDTCGIGEFTVVQATALKP